MKQKVALVLGSGGARGTAHIGVIRELTRHGYKITSISGTSMGALVGGIYASGKLDEFEEWLCNLSKIDVFSRIDFTLSKNGIIKADKFINEIKQFIPDQNIEDLAIPFAAIATDIVNRKEKEFTSGSLWDAIRASISIPLIVTPAKIEDVFFVDGGVLNPVPVNHVTRVQGDLMVAVNVNAQIPMNIIQITEKNHGYINQLMNGRLKVIGKKVTGFISANNSDSIGYFHLISETISLLTSQISKLTLEQNPPDVLISISNQGCGTYDFHKAKERIALGKIVTSECMENFCQRKLLP